MWNLTAVTFTGRAFAPASSAGVGLAAALPAPSPSWNLWTDGRELLRYPFMQNAFVAGTFVAIAAGVVGYIMVVRHQAFAGHALSQVGFPGAAGAALLGLPELVGVLTFVAATALGISVLGVARGAPGDNVTARNPARQAAAIGSVLAFALALGYLFTSLYHGYITSAYALLFGTFLGINRTEVGAIAVVSTLSVVALAAIGRPLLLASLDPDAAAARGVPVRFLDTAFLLVLGLAIAGAIRITGALLVFALLVAPTSAAHHTVVRPARAIALAVGLAVTVTWLSLACAYFGTYPIGFWVTTFGFVTYLAARAQRAFRRRFPTLAPAAPGTPSVSGSRSRDVR